MVGFNILYSFLGFIKLAPFVLWLHLHFCEFSLLPYLLQVETDWKLASCALLAHLFPSLKVFMSSLRSLSMLYIQSLSLQHLLYPVTFLYSPLLLPFSYPFSSPFPLLAFPSFTLLFSFDFALYFCPSHILSFPTFALFLSSSLPSLPLPSPECNYVAQAGL